MTDALLVLLNDLRVGVLARQADGRVDFRFLPEYLSLPTAPVLGQWFLDNPGRPVSSRARLPAWFSNLLPEGVLRELVADELAVSDQREFDLLRRLGEDLPGAARVLPADPATAEALGPVEGDVDEVALPTEAPLKFSLAGVQLKFSMVAEADRLTLPARGVGGDWIVKLPDRRFDGVPRNEWSMMSLARAVGIDVPEVRLVPIDQLLGLPALPGFREREAFAIRRYDRTPKGRVHQEDFAQVLGEYPKNKYSATNYETVANILLRLGGEDALLAFVMRLVFNVAIGNGDAHLKNWSLVYPNRRTPRLSPAYDLVATVLYMRDDGLALNLARSKRWEDVSRASFERLARRIGADPAHVLATVAHAVAAFDDAWAREAAHLPLTAEERSALDAHRARIPLFARDVS